MGGLSLTTDPDDLESRSVHPAPLRVPEPPWPTMGPEAFHGLAGKVVTDLDPHTEADPVAVLLSFLTAFGNAVGSGPHAVADGAPHPPRLNTVLVGDTSRARKGTSWANVSRVFGQADQSWSRGRVMSGLSTGEGLIAIVRNPDAEGAQGVEDKRVLVVEPEFARLLSVAGRDGNTLSAILRQAWDTGGLRIITRRDPVVASGAHISVIGHITLEELGKRLSDTEAANGFANRFLFALVRRSKLLPSGGDLDDQEVHALGIRVRNALDEARKLGIIRRTPEAEALWAERYQELADTTPPGLVGALTARAEAQFLRLSVVYALIAGSERVDIEHLDAAWAVWQYCADSVNILFAANSGDPQLDRLLEVVTAAGPNGILRSKVYPHFGGHLHAGTLDKLITTLVDQDKIRRATGPASGGRQAKVLIATGNPT